MVTASISLRGAGRTFGATRALTGTGRYRNIGPHAPDGVEHAEPSLEDAYLLLLRRQSPQHQTATEVTP